MNAPRYIQKSIVNQHQQNYEYKNHVKRLQEIKTKRSKTLSSNTSSSLDLKSKQQMRFLKQQIDKLNVINKENEALLGRLVNINNGKLKRFVNSDQVEDSMFKFIQKKADVSEIQRKIQEEKLKEENTQIVRRLIERIQKNEQLSKEQRQRAISEYLKQRKLMQKYSNYQAEPSKMNISSNENNISTEHNENSRYIRSNNLPSQERDQNNSPGAHSGELKLPPLQEQKNILVSENDISQRSQSSKLVSKGTHKNSITHGINSNNISLNSGSGNKYNYQVKGNTEINNGSHNYSNVSSNQINRKNTSNSSQKYEYSEQNSAMYQYENHNMINQIENLKSNTSQKGKSKEKKLLNNILQECYTKSDQQKSSRSMDQSKVVSVKNQDGNTSKVIQTNESSENMNFQKIRSENTSSKNNTSINTLQDIEPKKSQTDNTNSVKIGKILNTNQNKNVKLQNTIQQNQKNIKDQNNLSLASIQNKSKANQSKNTTLQQSNSSKQHKIPINKLRCSSEKIDLGSNQKVYKDKRRISTTAANNNDDDDRYDDEPEKINIKQNQKKPIIQDEKTIYQKRNSAQVVENEDIPQSYTPQKQSYNEEDYHQEYEIEEDECIQEDKSSQNKKQQQQKPLDSYNFYDKDQQKTQNVTKSQNRYQNQSQQIEDDQIIDEDFNL
ncbi:hypothetical protein TTHERM_00494560 (macronuclear) [Tetrahymena thermophila SB210]|uniref:Uncharacterized protein n=1 Tax=Tetrahymena thermophila (strain SB210) TaxID=312017 RepID=I7LWW7_TETTS|nr:hypothetical protein TTHERM_00494560 [Tetrahymena thermophila SB210]EAS02995.1 hypothetical protein TTHERM_00494560 [Tetrahymena thermophila SB210]|eukprot:XP_001023240.1 hypothetical protein TTHERM_00494560 [Tetrahymena thermophila SB210]